MQNNDPEVLDAKIESLAVYSWSPDRLGVERPTQVHMIMQLDGLRPDGRPCIAALRFKGPDTDQAGHHGAPRAFVRCLGSRGRRCLKIDPSHRPLRRPSSI